MSNLESRLMEDNLKQVWNEHNPDTRLEAIGQIYQPGATLNHVGHQVTGADAINRSVTETLGHLPPGFVFTLIRPVIINNNIGRLVWGAGPLGQPPAATGMDLAIFEEGRIKALYVFLD